MLLMGDNEKGATRAINERALLHTLDIRYSRALYLS